MTSNVKSANKQIVDEYIDTILGMHSRAERTAQTYRHRLMCFARAIKKELLTADVADVQGFLLGMRQKYSVNTRRQYQTVLRGFYGWAEKKHFAFNPTTNLVVIREQHTHHEIISQEDVHQIILAAGRRNFLEMRNAAIIVMLAETGIRREELIQLRLDHIVLKGESFIIQMDGRIKVKNYRLRNIPFCQLNEGDLVAELFAAYYMEASMRFSTSDYLFQRSTCSYRANGKVNRELPHVTPGPLSCGRINVLVRTIAAKAGVERVTPHTFRHFYATMLAKNDVPIMVIKERMGHSKIEHTTKYIHYAYEIKEGARLNPMANVAKMQGSRPGNSCVRLLKSRIQEKR